MEDKKSLADTVKEIIDSRKDECCLPKEYQDFLELSRRLDALFGHGGGMDMASPMQVHRQNQKMLAQAFDILHRA
ncbi:MAG: hypothetical protein IJS08_13815 [Victivallales bacterium]|nr:hypothetical protein [Victivallales bacterium]